MGEDQPNSIGSDRQHNVLVKKDKRTSLQVLLYIIRIIIRDTLSTQEIANAYRYRSQGHLRSICGMDNGRRLYLVIEWASDLHSLLS